MCSVHSHLHQPELVLTEYHLCHSISNRCGQIWEGPVLKGLQEQASLWFLCFCFHLNPGNFSTCLQLHPMSVSLLRRLGPRSKTHTFCLRLPKVGSRLRLLWRIIWLWPGCAAAQVASSPSGDATWELTCWFLWSRMCESGMIFFFHIMPECTERVNIARPILPASVLPTSSPCRQGRIR